MLVSDGLEFAQGGNGLRIALVVEPARGPLFVEMATGRLVLIKIIEIFSGEESATGDEVSVRDHRRDIYHLRDNGERGELDAKLAQAREQSVMPKSTLKQR